MIYQIVRIKIFLKCVFYLNLQKIKRWSRKSTSLMLTVLVQSTFRKQSVFCELKDFRLTYIENRLIFCNY